jgi:hypothetical protein
MFLPPLFGFFLLFTHLTLFYSGPGGLQLDGDYDFYYFYDSSGARYLHLCYLALRRAYHKYIRFPVPPRMRGFRLLTPPAG